ncbi:hypothetical protein C8R44DRAFT_885183 [Mycena epipterygia]|nr:hypothetical protein C8R44DRAFT_885183 [Mycena epipterygia]
MTPTSVLVAFILFTVAASLHPPGCLPDEDATIVSESIFQVPNPNTGETFTNLTLTYFTCPSRQAQAHDGQPKEGGLQTGEEHLRALKRQSQTPIDICGILDSSEVFTSTFNCDQASGDLPTLRDCANIDTAVVDSLIRPMSVTIPALSGLIVSLVNNTCAMVFLNDDANDNYATCLHTIPDMDFDIMEECPPPFRDGFIGSVRSPIQPGVQNWEVHIASSNSLYN